jgi:hypothetical protein
VKVIQIVPRLGPYDGVGDYALGLARGLRDDHGTLSVFVEAGERPSQGPVTDFEVRRCEPGSRATLIAMLGQTAGREAGVCVLLHYVGYGYAARGAPLWLARSLRQARRDMRFRFVVIFHELYANGLPWQSSFWLRGLQQHVARGLARECDGALLTREGSRRWLERTGALAGKPVEVLPVPSTVGEPMAVKPAVARRATLVVWGGAAAKRVVYGRHWPLVQAACAALGVTAIDDIGASLARYPRSAIDIQPHGLLPPSEVSSILGRSRFGVVAYPQAFLAKSSLFAALAAHGTVPVVVGEPCREPADGLVPGRHFMWLQAAGAMEGLDAVAGAARDWYRGHAMARHAAAVRVLLRDPQ